ncbi:MAG: hypothetical protein JXN64_01605 [Spirochaetes bacterium]|nr:hypothetical protein [Spirochaetota bacterium]
MKTLIKITIIIFTLVLSGCWNVYNDVLDDMEKNYTYYLTVVNQDSPNNALSVFSIDDDSKSLNPSSQIIIGGDYNINYSATDHANKYLYVTDAENSRILMYTISNNCTFEALGIPGYITTEAGILRGLRIHPSGNYLYAFTYGGTWAVYMYTIGIDGLLSYSGLSASISASATSYRTAIDPSGAYLFSLNILSSNSTLQRFEVNNGTLTSTASSVPYPTEQPIDIVMHPGGQYFFIATETGVLTYNTDLQILHTFAGSISNARMVIHPSGNYLYTTVDMYTMKAFQIQSDGSLVDINNSLSFSGGWGDIIILPCANRIYLANYGQNRINDIRIKKDGTIDGSYDHSFYWSSPYDTYTAGLYGSMMLIRKKAK